MSLDTSTKTITAPVSIYDVQTALGTNKCDLATLCGHNNINPMAKYKPVRLDNVKAINYAQRKSVRFGMNNRIPSFSTSNKNPSVTWVYDAVRVGTDWARLTDFENYYHLACVPFAFDVTGAIRDGVGIQLYVDSSAGNYYQDHEGSNNRWDVDNNLSISDLLADNSSFSPSGMYLGFAIHDLDDANGYYQVVVTSTKLVNVSSSVPTIILYPEARTAGGVTYPAVSILNDYGRNGHTYRFIAFIKQNYGGAAQSYEVLPNNQKAIDVYSLAIMQGVDRKELIMYDRYTIAGLTFSISLAGITWTYVGEVTHRGNTMYKYTITGSVVGVFKTPSTWPWHGSPDELTPVATTIKSDYGYVGDDSVQGSVVYDINANLATNSHTYTITIATFSNLSVYIFKGVPASERSIRITSYAHKFNETVDADNDITSKYQ